MRRADLTIADFLTDWKIQLGLVLATTRLVPLTWQGVARNCAEIKQQDTVGKKVIKAVWDCSTAGVAAVTTQFIAVASATGLLINIAPTLREWLQAHRPGQKRSIEDMDLHARDVLPHLSSLFGVEARHLGHWHDSVTGAAMRKRRAGETESEGVWRPVFGATFHGQQLHFSFLDQNEEDESFLFRFGMGRSDGSSTAGRLIARQDRDWFKEGGFDFKVTFPGHFPSIVDPNDIEKKDDLFAWIYSELMCNMKGYGHGGGVKGSSTNAMHIQVYDDNVGGTRLAAQAAVYGADLRSGMYELGDFMSSVDIDHNCAIEVGSTVQIPWLVGPW